MTNDFDRESRASPTIALVDHSQKDLDDLIRRLSDFKFPKSGDALSQHYNFVPICINEDEDVEALVNAAMEKIGAENPAPDMVLVDLSFGVRVPYPVTIGAKLASILQESLPVPVGVYTRYALQAEERVEISMRRFDAVFEHTFMDTKLQLADPYDQFFKDILQRRSRSTDVPYNRPLPANCKQLHVEWEPGQPITQSVAFHAVGPHLTKLALRELYKHDTNITISQLSGGFSGSYVLKVSVVSENRGFILKIDEDPSRLQRELEGLRTLVQSVGEQFYVSVIPMVTPRVITLRPGWWGALPLTFEEDAEPLISHQLSSTELAFIYTDLWTRPLSNLYRPTEKKDMSPADAVPESIFLSAQSSLQTLDRHLQTLKNRMDEMARGDLEAGVLALRAPRVRELAPVPGLRARAVHGDLNCRNILLKAKTLQYRLIDFPNVKPNWISTDFAKAEAELVLIMMDWKSGSDIDLARVGQWASLTRLFSNGNHPESVSYTDEELQRVGTALIAIRSMYGKVADGLQQAYFLNLFGTVARYLSYADITVAKRALALCWLGQLSDVLGLARMGS